MRLKVSFFLPFLLLACGKLGSKESQLAKDNDEASQSANSKAMYTYDPEARMIPYYPEPPFIFDDTIEVGGVQASIDYAALKSELNNLDLQLSEGQEVCACGCPNLYYVQKRSPAYNNVINQEHHDSFQRIQSCRLSAGSLSCSSDPASLTNRGWQELMSALINGVHKNGVNLVIDGTISLEVIINFLHNDQSKPQ